MYVLGPCGSLQRALCEAGSFSCCLNTHRCFQSEILRLYFPTWNPGLCGLPRSQDVPPSLSEFDCRITHSASHCLAPPSFSCPLAERPLPWLPVSTSPISLDKCFFFNSLVVGFPYDQFSGSSGYFLFLNLLLSFFWFCEEAQCVDLRLHLGGKSRVVLY